MVPRTKSRVTPCGLAILYLLGGAVGGALGTTPLAAWLDTVGTNQGNDTLRDWAPKVQALGERTGLNQPYKWLHEAVRDREAAKFFGSR